MTKFLHSYMNIKMLSDIKKNNSYAKFHVKGLRM